MYRLRLKTETIIALATTDYSFSYNTPSLLAAASLITALRSCSSETPPPPPASSTSPSSTTSPIKDSTAASAVISEKVLKDTRTCLQMLTLAGGDDLERCCCHMVETLPDYLTHHDDTTAAPASPDTTATWATCPAPPAASTPVARDEFDYQSAVDVFSDFNSSVLSAVLSPSDSSHLSQNSILVTY